MLMKLFISILSLITLISYPVSFAADHESGHKEEKSHKDWNEVFKQPVGNEALAQAPEKTQIIEPTFLAPITGSEVTLKWTPVVGVKYHLQVATDPNFKWLVMDEALVTYTEYNLKNITAGQQYFWRVYTQKPENNNSYTKGPAVSSSFEVQ